MRRALWSATIALLACGSDPSDGGDESTGTGPDLEPADAPVFIEPASGVLMLQTHRVGDVEMRIASVSQGLTRFVLDGQNYGDLTAAPEVGELSSDRLLLRVRGGLASTRHSFFLETPSVDEPARSAEIQVNILADTLPQITASVPTEAFARGTSVMAMGVGARGVLLVYDEAAADGPIVHAYRSEQDGWDLEAPVDVRVPPLSSTASGLPLAGAIAGDPNDPDALRLRLAWRASRDEIAFVDRPWLGSATAPRRALSLDDLPTEGLEFATLARPWIVGNTLLVEATLIANTEQPRPGDHRLAVVQLIGAPAESGPPALTAAAGTVDIDRIGPAIDLASAATGGPDSFAARIDGARPGVFHVEPESGVLRMVSHATDLAGWGEARHPVSAILGAFGSRTMLGVSGSRVVVQVADDSAGTEAMDVSGSLEGGGTAQDTGPPAVTVLRGHPVMLIPMGAEHPVQLIATAGARLLSDVIDLLRCDEIALPVGNAGATGMSVQFACRGGDEVRLGTLALAP